jgi:predicted MFS family arabinose efflux permease
MDEKSPLPLWKELFGALVVAIIAFGRPIGEFLGSTVGPEKVFAVFGIMGVLAVIWYAVRWLNDRHDPRNQKRPPEAP